MHPQLMNLDQRGRSSSQLVSKHDVPRNATGTREIRAVKAADLDLAGAGFLQRLHHIGLGKRPMQCQEAECTHNQHRNDHHYESQAANAAVLS